ncbi:phage baseplate assembly protein V [Crocosphaera sp.]|uniref:phage baseplate assembly protein V n=1 Tax=Crocosphaera sp. TaxID=2729996 RepID=UPI002603F22B|nr:phage baseplate assembly protein V [Crocosphaera sp.]
MDSGLWMLNRMTQNQQDQVFGKYRGKVTQTEDPLNLGRIQVKVAAITDNKSVWAMPCTPYAGKDIGFFTIPPVDTNVWVEFEGGDVRYPIWSGCFWGENELPQKAQVRKPEQVQVFKTDGATLTISNQDNNKNLTIEVENPLVEKPLKMVFNSEGIEINNNNKTTVNLKAETIEIKNGTNSTIIIAKDKIHLKESNIAINLTNQSIELQSSPATLTLKTSSGIELKNNPAIAKLTTSGIELSSTPATVEIAATGIELSNPIGNIKLSPAGVNINNGALQVT